VPARFLTDEQLATYGRYAADPPDQAVLERFFFLDDADRDLVATRRGDHGPSRKATAEIIARFAATGRDDPTIAARLGITVAATPSPVSAQTLSPKNRHCGTATADGHAWAGLGSVLARRDRAGHLRVLASSQLAV
jgi:hypothetical protein